MKRVYQVDTKVAQLDFVKFNKCYLICQTDFIVVNRIVHIMVFLLWCSYYGVHIMVFLFQNKFLHLF